MWFNILVLLTALTISGVAAYYSIIGLTAIFAAAFWPIVIMGGVLEFGKIVTSVWLKKYWHQAGLMLKSYLTVAVAILMLITSIGIFGFLSKAHLDQTVPTSDVAAKVQLLDEKIKTERDNIEAARRALSQMDAQVDQRLSRSDDDKGAERAVQIRRQQAKERQQLQNEIAAAQKKIAALNEERAPIASELRKVEAEVGPIKYVAALIYGDDPDANLLEKAVRWVIITIVIVFDPLAIALILAANSSMRWVNVLPAPPAKKEEDAAPEAEATPEVDVDHGECPKCQTKLYFAPGIGPFCPNELCDVVDGPLIEDVEPVTQVEPTPVYLTKPWKPVPTSDKQIPNPPIVDQSQEVLLESQVKELESTIAKLSESLKEKENDITQLSDYVKQMSSVEDRLSESQAQLQEKNQAVTDIKQQFESYVTESLTKESTLKQEVENQIKLKQEETSALNSVIENLQNQLSELLKTQVDILQQVVTTEPESDLTATPSNAGFGVKFPDSPTKGDMFVRVDYLPSRVFKFNGDKWIEVDKNTTDTYSFNKEYISHLITQLEKGVIELDQLSDSEQTQIKAMLKKEVVLGK